MKSKANTNYKRSFIYKMMIKIHTQILILLRLIIMNKKTILN